MPISITPDELRELIRGEDAIHRAMERSYAPGQDQTAEFAFASIVSIADIKADEELTIDNIWVKRPGGGIPANEYKSMWKFRAKHDIPKDTQIRWEDVC